MRLISVTVRRYRLHRELHVEFDPSRTLIGGPNETGKSTLVEAVHRALFLRASGNTESHRAMQSNKHGNHPEVELVFEAEGARHVLHKIFGANGSTRLTRNGGAAWQNTSADEELGRLLGRESVAGPAAKYVKDHWAHLWIWQGMSGDDPTGKIGKEDDALRHRLQAQGGTAVLQSPRDTALATSFAARTHEMYAANGNPKAQSALAQALRAEQAAQEAELHAKATLEKLEQAVKEHEQAGLQISQAATALVECASQQALLDQRAARISTLRTEEAQLRFDLDSARRRHATLAEADQTLRDLRQQLRARRLNLEAPRDQLAIMEEGERQSHADATAAEDAHQEAENRLRCCRALQDVAAARNTLKDKQAVHEKLTQRAQKVGDLREKLVHLERQTAALPPVDAAKLKALQKTESELAEARAALKAMATGVELVAHPPGQSITLAGKDLPPGKVEIITAPAELVAGPGWTVRIHPGGGTGLADARKNEARIHSRLAEQLTALGTPDVAAAVEVMAIRTQAESEKQGLKAELRGLGADKLGAELEAAAVELTAAQAELQRRLNAARDLGLSLDEAAPATPTTARTELDHAQTAEQSARAKRDALQKLLRDKSAQTSAVREAIREGEREIHTLEARLKLLQEQNGTDEERAATLATLSKAALEAEVAWTTCQNELRQLQPEQLEEETAQLNRTRKIQEDKRNQAEQRRAAAAALLHSDGSLNPVAALAHASAKARTAEETRRKVDLRSRAVKFVHELFQQEQQTLADQFTRPLAERATAYLQRLFGPDARVSLSMEDGRFAGFTIHRAGQVTAFEHLSGGAREQVAAAFRLGMAEILAEDHDGCLPVVFDDAFAYADPERVKSLQRMLDLAATRGLQVIVLSCAPGDYALLGAREVTLPSP